MEELDVHLSADDLSRAWDMLDVDESGELSIDEFVAGLAYLQEGLEAKHIVNVDYELKRTAIRFDAKIEQLSHCMNEVSKHTIDIAESLACRSKSHVRQQPYLKAFHDWASTNCFANG